MTRRRGFTLVEILVVIGIIVLLVGLLAPMVARAYRNAERARQALDLNAISLALEAYRQDFGDYPRVRANRNLTVNGPRHQRPNPMTGAQVLCFALMGPADEVEAGAPPNLPPRQDGAKGPGFRTRAGQGKVYGPYLPSDRFPVRDPNDLQDGSPDLANVLRFVIVDRYRQPILYFPAHPARPNIGSPNPTSGSYVGISEAGLWDADDNIAQFRRAGESDDTHSQMRIRLMLGDGHISHPPAGGAPVVVAPNGRIDGGDRAMKTGAFLLWSAGPDEQFGPSADLAADPAVLDAADVPPCDDVTNFR